MLARDEIAEDVRALVVGEAEVAVKHVLRARGIRSLKGLPEEVHLYSVLDTR